MERYSVQYRLLIQTILAPSLNFAYLCCAYLRAGCPLLYAPTLSSSKSTNVLRKFDKDDGHFMRESKNHHK
jgi:hypothetical protein